MVTGANVDKSEYKQCDDNKNKKKKKYQTNKKHSNIVKWYQYELSCHCVDNV